jgi:hypothetical protein
MPRYNPPEYAESDTDYEDDDVDVVENPASVVHTARDERLWRMAKASAARQGRARDWPYVMGIFQHMKHRSGSEPVGNPDDEPWYGSDEARAARLARSAAFQPPELPDYKAISERVERERLEAEEQERQRRKQSELQLRAEVVQQGLFAPSSYEAKPKKKKPAASDTRQVDMFGMPIDDKPRKNPRALRRNGFFDFFTGGKKAAPAPAPVLAPVREPERVSRISEADLRAQEAALRAQEEAARIAEEEADAAYEKARAAREARAAESVSRTSTDLVDVPFSQEARRVLWHAVKHFAVDQPRNETKELAQHAIESAFEQMPLSAWLEWTWALAESGMGYNQYGAARAQDEIENASEGDVVESFPTLVDLAAAGLSTLWNDEEAWARQNPHRRRR